MAAFANVTTQNLSDMIGRDVTTDAGGTIAIESACEMIRTLSEQRLDEVTNDTVTLDGTGTDVVLLPELPVNAVVLVTVGGGTVTDYVLNGNGMLIRGTAGARPYPDRHYWPSGRQNIRVTYSHGYTGGSVPADLRMVALSIASRLVIQGVASSEVMGDQQIRYGVNSTDLTSGEKAVIQKYRRHH